MTMADKAFVDTNILLGLILTLMNQYAEVDALVKRVVPLGM
jgi:hypothetical protein